MLAVAQFRRRLFKPTETFLYNYLTAFRRILPVCITFKRVNLEQFPYSYPLVELYSWHIWNRGWRWIRRGSHSQQEDSDLHYDLPKTAESLQRYDVRALHAHFGYTGSQVLPVKRESGLPLITTFYGEDISALPRSEEWLRVYERLFSEGDLFLVEGPIMRKKLLKIGCSPEKAEIQRIAIPIDRYSFRQRLPKKRGETVRILFCGSFREKKGLMYALDAVRHSRERFPSLKFRIIGEGELRPQVEQAIERYQMGSYTTLLGFQTHARMVEEMDKADIFISPSVTAANGDSEGGAPTTILEAQACGMPVIATHHGDIPNVVVPDGSALLGPERDAEMLGNNLCTLLAEQERWAEMGKLGRAFVEKYHSIAREIGVLEERYYELAGVGAV